MLNRLKRLPRQFRKILKITSELSQDLGDSIYLVGGVVRDLLLGREVFDLDIVVEGDAIKLAYKLAKCLKGEFIRHHNFGTASVGWDGHKIDFVTARTEEYPRWGALPRVKPASLDKDLIRRDFTINAMAISLNKANYGKLIDLYGGLADLKKCLIRVLHQMSFLEDPTRILRAIRFQQRFAFKIEAQSLHLMDEALKKRLLNLVSPHRLRDELILILKEPKPYRCIKKISSLKGFYFLDAQLKLTRKDFALFKRIDRALQHYRKNFKNFRPLQSWLIYLSGILIGFSSEKIKTILHEFGFKKGERIIITSIKDGLSKIRKLQSTANLKVIYRTLNQYSLESLLFFYAYYPKNKLRKNIDYFLAKLIHLRLQVRGKDLKEMGFVPATLYSKTLQYLIHSKINKGLVTRDEELGEARSIFKRLTRNIKARG